MTECIICLENIDSDSEYAIIHNANEVNKLHPECIQKWTEHSLIGLVTLDLITAYSVFKNDRYIKTVIVKEDQPRTLVGDVHLTFSEIWNKIFSLSDDDSYDLIEDDSEDEEIEELEDIQNDVPEPNDDITDILTFGNLFNQCCICL